MAGAYSAGCAGLSDTAVVAILVAAMLGPWSATWGRVLVCLYRSRIAGPGHLCPQPLVQWAKRHLLAEGVRARQRLLLVRLFSSRFTLVATPFCDCDLERHLSLGPDGVSLAFRVFPVAPLQVPLPLLPLTIQSGPSGLRSISTILKIRRHTFA